MMMPRSQLFLLCPLLLALLMVGAAPARADGTVLRASGCGEYIFVSTVSGYSVLRADSGSGVKDGDRLTGEVERIGSPLLFDATAGRSVFAQVAELHLNQVEVTQRISIRCRSPLGETLASGYVARVNGCGSWIFINTPQGYAVLERISGGVVAEGDTITGNYNRPGRATVQDKQSASTLTVFVSDLWLSKSAAERKMTAVCRR